MNIFQNVTKGSFAKGASILIVLAGAQGAYATKWGVFGFFLTGIPLWCFGVFASIGGILFFLWPMIFGSEPEIPLEQGPEKSERMLFLYLRPFELDARNTLQLIVGASVGTLIYSGLIEGVWWPLSFLPLAINISKEQSFKDAFDPVGEFITFGHPRERLRPIGASRVYYGNDWRQQVTNYMARARLVIVRPGKSPSIEWEVQEVLRTVSPERILFFLRFRGSKRKREQAYENFKKLVTEVLPIRLPEKPDESPYLVFDAAWNPRFVREANRPAELFRQLTSRSGDILVDRLRPVLKAVNIDVPAQSDNLLSKVITVLTWLIVLVVTGLMLVTTFVAVLRVAAAFTLYLLHLVVK